MAGALPMYRRRHRLRLRPLALLSLLAAACSGANGTSEEGVIRGTVASAVISLPVSIDGSGAKPFVVDTGAPLTLVDPRSFPAVDVSLGQGHVATLDVGDVHLTDVTIIGASPCGVMTCAESGTAGLLGGDVLIDFELTINYRAATVGFDTSAVPVGLGAPVSTTFGLEGGGRITLPGSTSSVQVPATRITIDVDIEGTTYPFVLDTGSSQVVVRPELYDEIVSDGRAQSTTTVSTVSGTVDEPTTHLASVSVAGVTQTDVAAVRSPLNLDVLSAEVGHTVDGLLGGSYLSHYVVTIDYPTRQLTLRSTP